MEPIKILIVEDEIDISQFIQMELEYEGYLTDTAFDGREAIRKCEENEYDLLLLDVMLPKLNGMEILRRVRKTSNVPVIMLTAKDDVTEKVMGLDIGASDYITKPFVIEELLARIRVVIRDVMPDRSGSPMRLSYEGLVMDIERRIVTRNNKRIELTKNEFIVLQMLLRNVDEIVKREDIIATIWGDNFVGDTNALDVYISHLRRKIDLGFDKKIIHTVRGIGYKLKEDSIDS